MMVAANPPQVSVLESSNVPNDADALHRILPSSFRVESTDTHQLFVDERNVLIIVHRSKPSKEAPAVIYVDGDILHCVKENIDQVPSIIVLQQSKPTPTQKDAMHFLNIMLPSGSHVTIASLALWTSSSDVRSDFIAMLATQSLPSNAGSAGMLDTQQTTSSLSTSDNDSVFITTRASLSLQSLGAEAEADADPNNSSNNNRSFSTMASATTPAAASTIMTPRKRNATLQRHLFPTLKLDVSSQIPFPPNTTKAVPIETDLFVGKLLFILRPSNPEKNDPYWNERIFSNKKRRVIMQLQGRFKVQPDGELFAGMEISKPKKLGLIANGICGALLQLLRSFNASIHYSFGDDTEKPHIVFPAATFFERLVVTPPDATPPELGEDLDESKQSQRDRKSGKTKMNWNTTDTYSMSFHSMYFDFPTWSLANLPFGKDLGLDTFWGNAFASVVLYDVAGNAGSSSSSRKNHSNPRYFVSMNIRHKDNEEYDALGLESGAFFTDQLMDDVDQCGELESEHSASPSASEMEYSSDDDVEFFDTVQIQNTWPIIDEVNIDASATTPFDLLRVADNCCPCWIDVCGKRGKYSKVFAFSFYPTGETIFRSASTASGLLGSFANQHDLMKKFSPRLSSEEKTRRDLGLRFAMLYKKQGRGNIATFMHHKTKRMRTILERTAARSSLSSSSSTAGSSTSLSLDTTHLLTYVCRALSDRHWIEELAELKNGCIKLIHPGKMKLKLRIKISSITRVAKLESQDCPKLNGFFFLTIETLGRTCCLMFKTKEGRNEWETAIQRLMFNHQANAPSGDAQSLISELMEVDDPMKEYLHHSSEWDCGKRRLLNCRQHAFAAGEKLSTNQTLGLAERALALAARIQQPSATSSDLRDFLDATAAIKHADVFRLSENQRLAFFINLYHLMLVHAFIVLGPPTSGLAWVSYFNTIAFQASDDIFSLSELEHNIIRCKMTYPSQFVSRFILPKSTYPFALSQGDFRINFVLHSGSTSYPIANVPTYRVETLDEQLSRTTADFLSKTVTLVQKGRQEISITLPKVCQWFAMDFGDGTANGILRTIGPYLCDDKQSILKSIWNEKSSKFDISSWSIKYLPFNFECQNLKIEGTDDFEI